MRVTKEFLSDGHRELLEKLENCGKSHHIFVSEGNSLGPMAKIDNKTVLNFGSLNILGIGLNQGIINSGCKNLKRYGYGYASTHSLTESLPHKELEKKIADFKGCESVLLFNTGYTASEATVELLTRPASALGVSVPRNFRYRTMIFYDQFTHASMHGAIDVYKRSLGNNGAKYVHSFEHLNYAQLEEMLKVNTKDFSGLILIVGDALYSMNGTFADTKKLVELAKKYNAIVVLDGAHSDGVYGPRGRGVPAMQGVAGEDYDYIIEIGTLSKAPSSIGGYVTLPKATCEVMKRAHPRHMFTVGRPAFIEATDIDVFDFILSQAGENRRKNVHQVSEYMRVQLKKIRINTLNSQSHIIPVVVGEEKQCYLLQRYLFEKEGIFTNAIPQGVVSKGNALLRNSIGALHTEEHIDRFLKALQNAMREGFTFKE